MSFKANDKVYEIDPGLRDHIKPGWQTMLLPAKDRLGKGMDINSFVPSVYMAEKTLNEHGETMVGKQILEAGCNEGARSYLMAKYQDTVVHGIDVDEYTIDQSPDMKVWNPIDAEFMQNKFRNMRASVGSKFPQIMSKVSFETASISSYMTPKQYDMIISWDTLEHVIDIQRAFKNMYDLLKNGGVAYHEYNPFFAINGGHSLCTLDFLYGHCRLNSQDFDKYVRELRMEEEEIDRNFYHKCLNRATRADIRKLAEEAGFEVLLFAGRSSFDLHNMMKAVEMVLPEVKELYPTVTLEDLIHDQVQLVLRKK